MTTASHRAAHHALVKMLYDPTFAARVRQAPDVVLAHLPSTLRASVARVDARALLADPLRRQRSLRALCDELKGSVTIALHETRRFAFLEAFFASTYFHVAVEERGRLVYALADYLIASDLKTPALRPLCALERTLAVSRRDRRAASKPYVRGERLQRAPGVVPIRSTVGASAALNAVERYLFEVSLLPQVALCDDGPRVPLPTYDAKLQYLVALPLDGKTTLVTVDEPTVAALENLTAASPDMLDYLGESELVECLT